MSDSHQALPAVPEKCMVCARGKDQANTAKCVMLQALMLRAGGTEGMFHYPGPLDDLHKFLPNPEQHKHAYKLLRRMLSPAQEERPVCDTVLRSKFVASPVEDAGVALPNTAV